MKKITRMICCICMLVLLLCAAAPAFADSGDRLATVLFTHDLHSHILPATNEEGESYGGYSRLMTAIDAQKKKFPDAILVDAGDFSMGSLFQTAYASEAIELRMMGAMGYDATTFGNHEYDYLPAGLASMLNSAVESGDPLPAIVECNYLPPESGEPGYSQDSILVRQAFDNYGVQNYILLERGGIYYVIFGLMGIDSDACAPNSGQILRDCAESAQRVVDEATALCREKYQAEPLVICLSHSGTENGKGEDYQLAQKVNGIDLIVSGHTHTALEEPIQVNGTYIVSAGEYSKYLGMAQLRYSADGSVAMEDYSLIPIDDALEEDLRIQSMTEDFKRAVEESYLSRYGFGFDEVLVQNPYPFESARDIMTPQHDSALGNLLADAYRWAAEKTLGVPVDLALTASGVIRESIPMGDVTVSDVFNIASLGVGTEGELICAYLTGRDLKTVLEVDASVQPIMNTAHLFCSGVEYSYNTRRMLFNKVDSAMLCREDGTLAEIQDDQLYRIVTGRYVGGMLGSVESSSMGLLQIVPRDESGAPIPVERLSEYVIRDENGVPVKEWFAIASYLKQMGGTMDSKYAAPDGRKLVYSSWSPISLYSNPNVFTCVLLGAEVAAALLLAVLLRCTYRKQKLKKIQRKRNEPHDCE